ncbi:MAG: efflux RND transporter periplasmic adaptor subunit [Oxalobacter formigenes]|nr:efflux RND transporter periplasmic adaptor subunit [Oxalobacter formigenes]
MKTSLRSVFFTPFIIALVLLSGCREEKQQEQQAPEAAYIVVKTEEVAVVNELSGRLESFRNSDVRARVAGVLEKRLFAEGSDVKKGDKLFIIDPRSYEAAVQHARAALARAEANFMQADLKYRRYIPLAEISAVSKQEYDDALAAQKQAAADVVSAKAALVNAKLDLEYSTVLAPISGRIGRSIVTEGALVGQGEVTLLAVIQQIDPIYLNLTQSSAELLQLQQAMRKGVLKGASEEGLNVGLIMEDGTPYPHSGKLLFSDITVDPSTGEISIRALFPNPDGVLLPGMYVRGRLEQAVNENAITIPKQAIQRSTEGSTVFVIGKDDTAEVRRVKTGASCQEKWIVLEGLNVGDKVIVEGIQKIRAGSPVIPVPWEKAVRQPEADTAGQENKQDSENIMPEEQPQPEKTQQDPQQAAETAESDPPVTEEKDNTLSGKTVAVENTKPVQNPVKTDPPEPASPALSANATPVGRKPAKNADSPAEKPTAAKPVAVPGAKTENTPEKEKNNPPVTGKPTDALRTLPAGSAKVPKTDAVKPQQAGIQPHQPEAELPASTAKE